MGEDAVELTRGVVRKLERWHPFRHIDVEDIVVFFALVKLLPTLAYRIDNRTDLLPSASRGCPLDCQPEIWRELSSPY